MNPHYGNYYGDDEAITSPGDSLTPNPIKFLTVQSGATFIFRAIAPKKDELSDKVKAALKKALTEDGVGAKTAIGYGIFEIESNQIIIQTDEIIWETANLIWTPGNQTLTASFENNKALNKGEPAKKLVPESLQKKLFDKKKAVSAKVSVEKLGNQFKILKIETV
ncbi:MAG: type III-B CRISPR module RAMP protein Cmr6 [Desulfobacterales bacterium]|nr:type III-B CRISPR module RAMP protein Cmr6 [Desulfobacterales bacterium]